jgi:hypothetical protein
MLTIEESIAEARALIASGKTTDDLWLLELKDEVYESEREQSQFRGGCTVGCSPENIVNSCIGLVCRWTRQPCERARLSNLIELFETINRNQTPTLLEGIHCDHHLSR